MSVDLEKVKHDLLIVDELARRGFRHARSYGNQLTYRCPLPGHDDHEPNFTVYRDSNTFRCYGCDAHGSIIDLLALLDDRDTKDVIRELTGGGEGVSTIPGKGARVQRSSPAPLPPSAGCTVEALAGRCKLPVDHLKSFGLSDMTYMGSPAVRIPYTDQDGAELAVQYRVALEKKDGVDRFKWRKGSKPTLYGWSALTDARNVGYVVVVEGASDHWTLAHHGFVSVGLPSATGYKNEYANALAGIDKVCVVIEPDEGGTAVREAFKSSPLADRVHLIYMSEEAGDPSELHKIDPEGFRTAFNRLLSSAVPLGQEIHAEMSAAYSTETDQAFHAHADQPFHFMAIRSERSDALGLPS